MRINQWVPDMKVRGSGGQYEGSCGDRHVLYPMSCSGCDLVL